MASVGRMVRSGLHLYASSIANNVTGYVYWLLISKIAGSRILGLTSAVVGLSVIINGILGLGLGMALQRHVGACRGERECVSSYFWSVALFSATLYLGGAITLSLLGYLGISLASYTPDMLKLAAFLVALGVSQVPFSYAIALLKTRLILISSLVGNTLKLLIGVLLVKMGLGWTGATIGYALSSVAHLLILGPSSLSMSGRIRFSLNALASSLKAGVSVWLPGVIALLGQWAGVLAVFNYSGAVETGYYYVANAIASFALAVSTIVIGVLIPVLSSMPDGRKRLASNSMRLGLVLITPLTLFIAVYPGFLLGLLGKEYVSASQALTVLALGGVPLLISNIIGNLVYAYGLYPQVLGLGLSQTLPRILLYFILTPRLGGLGAATALTIGSYTGLGYAVYLSRTIGYRIDASLIARVIMPALIVGLAVAALDIPWPLGLVAAALLYPLYARLHVVSRRDLAEISRSFLSDETLRKAYQRFKPIIDFVIPE